MDLGGPAIGTKMFNINVNSNVTPGGQYPLYSIGGGTSNCFAAGTLNYAAALAGCWVGTSSFTGNVVLNNGNTQKIVWPTGNTIVSSGANVVSLKTSLLTQIQ